MMLSDHDVIRTLVNIALLRQLVLASWCIFHSLLDIRSHIDVSPREESNSERCTLQIRSITRSHALRFGLTSYLKPIRVSDLDSFVSAIFVSMYDLALQNLRHWESLLESSRQYIAEEALEYASLRKSHRWKSYIAEETCTETSDQTELVRILSRRHRRMLWRSVEKYNLRRKIIKKSVDIIWRKKN